MTIDRKVKINLWVRNILFVLTLVFGIYIYYLRTEYDLSQQRENQYKEQRNALVVKFDSLTKENLILENKLLTQKAQNKILQTHYDSLKGEFYKKQNASTVTNRPILHYNVNQLDSFWQHFRFGEGNN